jgi:hypothetical protein
MRLAILILLVCALPYDLRADEWAYLHPETVTKFACDVQMVEVVLVGDKDGPTYWQANGRAERTGMDEWRFKAGEFLIPPGRPKLALDGRHKAEQACSRFMDKMTKQIQKLKK